MSRIEELEIDLERLCIAKQLISPINTQEALNIYHSMTLLSNILSKELYALGLTATLGTAELGVD